MADLIKKVSWPQALVSCVAIAAGTIVMCVVPDAEARMAGAAILGTAVSAGIGAFRSKE